MVGPLFRCLGRPAFIALGILMSLGSSLLACDFCAMQDRTLTKQVNESSLVLFGSLTNAKETPEGEGTTDFSIDAVVKKHEIVGDKKVVTLARYIPNLSSPRNKDSKFLVLCDVFKGKIDPLFLVPCKSESDIAKYLKGAIEVKDKDTLARLRFFLPFLDNAEQEIANDAFKEFANASNKDVETIAKTVDPDKLMKWLEDPNTPPMRYGVYGMMLGYCGKEAQAKRLRALLDDSHKRLSGMDGLLAGYTLISPKDGWAYLRDILKDDKKEFMTRYAGLRAVRFFHDNHKDVIPEKDVIEAMTLLLDQSDISDLAIEDLRKWSCWDLADRILALHAKKSHDIPIIRRSILRYALQCPDKKAQQFVADLRKSDKQLVEDAEELLKLEVTPPSKPASK
jgi:hypothetical protein